MANYDPAMIGLCITLVLIAIGILLIDAYKMRLKARIA